MSNRRHVLASIGALCLLFGAGCATPPAKKPTEDTTEDKRAPDAGIVQLDVGGGHACAVHNAGHVYCWGRNDFGQLGDGTQEERETPVRVRGVADAVQVSVGAIHTCVRHADSSVSCWGNGKHGRTGLGDAETHAAPEQVLGMATIRPRSTVNRGGGYRPADIRCDESSRLDGIFDIAAGVTSTCALHESGAVLCWGSNDDRQLGVSSAERVVCPAPVYAIEGAVDIDAGHDSACAALSNGRVRCWGDSQFGALSEMRGESIEQPFTTMRQIEGLEDATRVSMGTKHACAVDREQRVWCWGDNEAGTLGSGGPTITRAQRVPRLENIVDINVAGAQTCAAATDGTLSCWGRDVGPMSPDGPLEQPTPIPGLAGVSQVSLGGYMTAGESGFSWGHEAGFACAIGHRGTVSCWGENIAGSLGDTKAEVGATPRLVALGNPSDVTANGDDTSAPSTPGLTTVRIRPETNRRGERAETVECDRDTSYGPADAANVVSFDDGEFTHTVRFRTAQARWERHDSRRRADQLLVDFQPVALSNEPGAGRLQLGLDFTPQSTTETDVRVPARLRLVSLPREGPLSCVERALRDFGTVHLSRLHVPDQRDQVRDGIVAGEFDFYAGSPELGRVHGRFQTRDILEEQGSDLRWSRDDSIEYNYKGRPVENLRAAASYTVGTRQLELKFHGTAKYESFGKIRERERDFSIRIELDALEPGLHRGTDDYEVIDIQRVGIDGIAATVYRRQDEGDDPSKSHPLKTVPPMLGRTDNSTGDEALAGYEKLGRIETNYLTLQDGPLEAYVLGGDEENSGNPDAPTWVDVSSLSLPPQTRFYVTGDQLDFRTTFSDALGGDFRSILRVARDGEDLVVENRPRPGAYRLKNGDFTTVDATIEPRLRYPTSYVEAHASDLAKKVEGGRYVERPSISVEVRGQTIRVAANSRFQPASKQTVRLDRPAIPEDLLVLVLGQLEYEEGFVERVHTWELDLDSHSGGSSDGYYRYYELEVEERPVTIRVVGERTVEVLSGTYDVWVVEAGRLTYLVDKEGGGVVARTAGRSMQLLTAE